MIDLKKKPFFLDEEACQWVKKTLEGMSDEEKVGQLFCEILWDRPGREPEDLFEVIEPGGVMYRPFPGEKCMIFQKDCRKKLKFLF